MIKVHITDDHKMVVEGFREVVDNSGIAIVCGISYRLSDCRKHLAREHPDVLLLDIEMPDGSGIEFFSEMKKKYPKMKIIALTTHDEYSVVKHLIDNGISGYILKSAYSEEIIDAIETVVKGDVFICKDTKNVLNSRRKIPVRLTNREIELLDYLLKGLTNEQAADEMELTVETVKSYRRNIKLKLNAHSAMQMGKIAYEHWKFFFDDKKE
ncbi:MAG: response regulator transcription factor [Bacteroidales bacterium]|nr:response regulator transcription factor [Bacteroidales bacterium]